MEIETSIVRMDIEFVYSAKPKLTMEEIIEVKLGAIKHGVGVGEWIAEAIRRRLVTDNISGRHSPA